jgi:hypothetical protein
MIKLADLAPIAEVMASIEETLSLTPGNISVDVGMVLARDCVKRVALRNLASAIEPHIREMYEAHVMAFGELAVGARTYVVEPWVEPLEEQFLALVDGYREVLSAHWLVTADTKTPRYANEVPKVSDSFAEEVYKNITYIHENDNPREKTDAQVLSAVGVMRTTIEMLLANRTPVIEQPKEQDMDYVLKDIIATMNEMAEMSGWKGKALFDLLDNATDTDAGLAAAGLQALGLEATQKNMLIVQDVKRRYGLDHFTVMVENNTPAPAQASPPVGEIVDEDPLGVNEFMGETALAAPAGPKEGDTGSHDGKPTVFINGAWAWDTRPLSQTVDVASDVPAKRTRTRKAAAPATASTDGTIPAAALKIIKDFTSLKGDEFANGIGVSRATFDNYTKGKGPALVANDKNKAFLREVVQTHLDNLEVASSMLEALG